MPAIGGLSFEIDEHPGAGGGAFDPTPPHTIYLPGPLTTLSVAFDVLLNPAEQDYSWTGTIAIMGADTGGRDARFLFNFTWLGYRIGRSWNDRQFVFYRSFRIPAGRAAYRFSKQSDVDRLSLDANPPEEREYRTRDYGILTVAFPNVDRIFARVQLDPEAGSPYASVYADSGVVEGIFEWPQLVGTADERP